MGTEMLVLAPMGAYRDCSQRHHLQVKSPGNSKESSFGEKKGKKGANMLSADLGITSFCS